MKVRVEIIWKDGSRNAWDVKMTTASDLELGITLRRLMLVKGGMTKVQTLVVTFS